MYINLYVCVNSNRDVALKCLKVTASSEDRCLTLVSFLKLGLIL